MQQVLKASVLSESIDARIIPVFRNDGCATEAPTAAKAMTNCRALPALGKNSSASRRTVAFRWDGRAMDHRIVPILPTSATALDPHWMSLSAKKVSSAARTVCRAFPCTVSATDPITAATIPTSSTALPPVSHFRHFQGHLAVILLTDDSSICADSLPKRRI